MITDGKDFRVKTDWEVLSILFHCKAHNPIHILIKALRQQLEAN
jgi:hypothetical protein